MVMKQLFSQLNYRLSKKASRSSSSFVWISLSVIAIIIIAVPWLGKWIKPLRFVSRFLVDALTAVSLRNIPYDGTYSWFSSIAYAIGVILLSGLLIPIITNHLRTLGNRYLSGALPRYNWHRHILFLGYDELMIATLRKQCQLGKTVVVAVPDNVEAIRGRLKINLGDMEYSRVEVIQCNKTDLQDLQDKACVGRADTVFIVGQPDDATHDASNIRSLDAIANIVGDEINFSCYLYIRNRSSLSLVQRQGFDGESENKLRRHVNPFNFNEEIAARLLTGFDSRNTMMTLDYQNERRNLAVCPKASVHLVIMGMTEVGLSIARETLMVAHYPGHRVTITLVDENAREEMFIFRRRYKELFNHCQYSFEDLDGNTKDPLPCSANKSLIDIDFEFLQGSVAHPVLMKRVEQWSCDEHQLLTLVFCTNNSPRNMACALYLPRPLLEGDDAIPVWVYQQGDDSLKEFSGHGFYKTIHTFTPYEYGHVEHHNSLMQSWAEEVAKAHNVAASGRGETKKWHELTQYERWSSLYNVRSIITKLRGMGYEIIQNDDGFTLWYFSDGRREQRSAIELSPKELLILAETEHLRWNTDTLVKGFRPTTKAEHRMIANNKSLKAKFKNEYFAHDDLRDYDDLDDDTKHYDIIMTKTILNAINNQLQQLPTSKRHINT